MCNKCPVYEVTTLNSSWKCIIRKQVYISTGSSLSSPHQIPRLFRVFSPRLISATFRSSISNFATFPGFPGEWPPCVTVIQCGHDGYPDLLFTVLHGSILRATDFQLVSNEGRLLHSADSRTCIIRQTYRHLFLSFPAEGMGHCPDPVGYTGF